jgi:hypothetical protein
MRGGYRHRLRSVIDCDEHSSLDFSGAVGLAAHMAPAIPAALFTQRRVVDHGLVHSAACPA